MTTSTLAHWSFADGSKAALRRIDHRSRRVVHRSHEHTCERNGHVMFRTNNILRFRLLQSAHTFHGEQVGPGARHDCRSDGTVKINNHLSRCGFATYAVIEVNDLLIITLHEINLDSFDPPFRKLIQRWF